MRSLILAASAFLSACTMNSATAEPVAGGPPQPTPVHGVTPGHACRVMGTDPFVGQPGTSKTGAAILRASRAAVLRWAPPGYALTMDYREDRVTVFLGADYKITAIKCG